MSDFLSEFNKTAKRWPASLAFASESGHIDYENLAAYIDAVAANALSQGFEPGQRVFVECVNPEIRFITTLGLMRIGLTVAVTHELDAFGEQGVELDALISDKPSQGRAGRTVRLTAEWFKAPDRPKSIPKKTPDYALIFSSSGSTGRVKLIETSRKNIEYRIACKCDDAYFGDNVRFLSTAGGSTLASFADFLIVLMKGGPIIRLNDRSGRAILDATGLYQPTYVSMAPLTLVDVLRTLSHAPRKFRKVDYLRLAGAYCSVATREKAMQHYAENVLTSYGATEICRVAWGNLDELRNTEGSVGRIIDGVIVETIGGDGKPLPEGSEGEIRIKPPEESVTTYLGAKSSPNVLRDGWFYPGDIGRVDSSGLLIVTGRKSQVINLGGNKISPEAAEAKILEIEGIKDVAVAPIKGRHGFHLICALVVKDSKVSIDDINRYLFKKQANFAIRRLKFVPAIPRASSGKIDRPAVQAMAEL